MDGRKTIGELASDIELQLLANQAAMMLALCALPSTLPDHTRVPIGDLLKRRVEETRVIVEEQRRIRSL